MINAFSFSSFFRFGLASPGAPLPHLAVPRRAFLNRINHALMRHFAGSLHRHQEAHPTQPVQVENQSDGEDCTRVAHIYL